MASTESKPAPPTPAADHCWSRIGVMGDGTCPELAKFVHCANCPVFSAAGRGLLDRAAPESYAREWEAALRNPEDKREQAQPVLVFRVGPEWLALPASSIAYVTENRGAHRLPHRSNRVLSGLVNINGELHLAFDLRALLELADDVPGDISLSRRVYPRLLLCRRGQQSFAFASDEVYGIAALEPGQLQVVPATVSKALATYTRGLFTFRERTVGLLDDELLAHSIARQHLE